MSAPAAPTNCMCAECHDTTQYPHGVDATDPFHAAVACDACMANHQPRTQLDATPWVPDEGEE
jgi:hypothetical protein